MSLFDVIKYKITEDFQEADLEALPKFIYRDMCIVLYQMNNRYTILMEPTKTNPWPTLLTRMCIVSAVEHRPNAAKILVDFIKKELKKR